MQDRRIEELTLLLNQSRQFREAPHNSRQGNHLLLLLHRSHVTLTTQFHSNATYHISFISKKKLFFFCSLAPSAVHSLSNGRSPSVSSEEGEHGSIKNADSASAKSDDLKSEVGTNDAIFPLYFFQKCNFDISASFNPSQVSTNSNSSQQASLLLVLKEIDSRYAAVFSCKTTTRWHFIETSVRLSVQNRTTEFIRQHEWLDRWTPAKGTKANNIFMSKWTF